MAAKLGGSSPECLPWDKGKIPKGNGIPAPDMAGGTFMVIATQDVTTVGITPTTKTSGGHTTPFATTLSKGQCYLVRSDGLDASHDLSGTIIEATKPIIVLSGHEDAFLGDGSNVSGEQRNFMIEQMIPVEYWDSIGYVSIPFKGTVASTTTGGIGDTYRVYTHDPGSAAVRADVSGFGSYDMSTSPLSYSEHADINNPTDIYSTNGHTISVMQYDQRSQGSQKPYPAPSMMTVIPHSRWRNTYNFSEFDPAGITGVNPNQYVGVLADSINSIKVSVDGAAEGPVTNLGSLLGTDLLLGLAPQGDFELGARGLFRADRLNVRADEFSERFDVRKTESGDCRGYTGKRSIGLPPDHIRRSGLRGKRCKLCGAKRRWLVKACGDRALEAKVHGLKPISELGASFACRRDCTAPFDGLGRQFLDLIEGRLAGQARSQIGIPTQMKHAAKRREPGFGGLALLKPVRTVGARLADMDRLLGEVADPRFRFDKYL